jgi:N-acetylglucosaminyldiphosphoundecaprenol N-acetyl-beta-D-mannosaminyltransferase
MTAETEPSIPVFPVLGTNIHSVNYETALEACLGMAKSGIPGAVSACNTHLIALARADAGFHGVMADFDLVVPDGYPLIWRLNAQGAKLPDRVYGPYLMRHVLTHTPEPWKHFFFGGTPECLERMVAAAEEIQPDIKIAGTHSPPFRAWTEEDEETFAEMIHKSSADFIWVALGGERQERWIMKNLQRHTRGVFFAVGDAFELLAGARPYAPPWMQNRGLTWLYRLSQEPRRLGARYLKFNSLFLYYLLRDGLLGTPTRLSAHRPRIAFLGSRGIPARYSGFETVVEQLGQRLVGRGYDVSVYNRYPRFDPHTKLYKGMRIHTLPTIPTKNLDTISHTALSALHALGKNYDLIYLCGVGNALIGGFLRLCGKTVIINVDGADFRRSKWSTFGRFWLHLSERWATRMADRIIADNQEIVARYEQDYQTRPLYLSYGANIRVGTLGHEELEHWGLKPREYILFVSRLTPENQADTLLLAFAKYRGPLKLVICGAADYEQAHYRRLQSLADDRVIFTGARYDNAYVELSRNALFFVMPADIEATRLVLLDQLGMGSAILYMDCPATREVVGDAAEPFDPADPVESLAKKLTDLADNPERCEELRRLALERAQTHFNWDLVVDRYESLFAELKVRKIQEKAEELKPET